MLKGDAKVLLNAVQDLTLVVVGFTMAPALAHALELPGKMRVTKDVYFQVQTHLLSRIHDSRLRRTR
jgi:hypothetical protein